MFGLGLDYGLGFISDIRLRQDPQLQVSHLFFHFPRIPHSGDTADPSNRPARGRAMKFRPKCTAKVYSNFINY